MEPNKLKIGDVVWIYEASVHQCSQGVIAGVTENGRLYSIAVPYYTTDGKSTMDQYWRSANEIFPTAAAAIDIFPTAAAAIDGTAKQFFETLRTNTYIWQKEQEKRKSAATKIQPEVENA